MNNYIQNVIIKKEICEKISDIKNDIVRECFEYFNTDYCTITFNSNILATGSGLASSSSYTISVIKAVSMFQGIELTDVEVCNLAFKIEKKFSEIFLLQEKFFFLFLILKKVVTCIL